MNKMKIEIWSDIACPYCYIGKRKLEAALEQFPHKDKVELVWHSYELDPTLPMESSANAFYPYFAKSHSMTEDEAMHACYKVAELAEEVGLHYNFDKLVLANTSRALRLVKLANEFNLATEAEEALFKAYFVEGLDISDKETLIRHGVEIGLPKDRVIEMLDGDKYAAEVKQETAYSENELKLEFIPFYLFNNKHVIQGSIAMDGYLEVLQKAYSEWKKNGVGTGRGDAISGQSCSIDGHCS